MGRCVVLWSLLVGLGAGSVGHSATYLCLDHLIRTLDMEKRPKGLSDVPVPVWKLFSFVRWGLGTGIFYSSGWEDWLKDEPKNFHQPIHLHVTSREINQQGKWGDSLKSLYDYLWEEARRAAGGKRKLEVYLERLAQISSDTLDEWEFLQPAFKWYQITQYLSLLEQMIEDGQFQATSLEDYIFHPAKRRMKTGALSAATLKEYAPVAKLAVESEYEGSRTLGAVAVAYLSMRLAQKNTPQPRPDDPFPLTLTASTIRQFTSEQKIPNEVEQRGRLYAPDDGNQIFIEQSFGFIYAFERRGEVWKLKWKQPSREQRTLAKPPELIANRWQHQVTAHQREESFTVFRNLLPDGTLAVRDTHQINFNTSRTKHYLIRPNGKTQKMEFDIMDIMRWSDDGRYLVYQKPRRETSSYSSRPRPPQQYWLWDLKTDHHSFLGTSSESILYDQINEAVLDVLPRVPFRDHFYQELPAPGGWWLARNEWSHGLQGAGIRTLNLHYWGRNRREYNWLFPEPLLFTEISPNGLYLAAITRGRGLVIWDLRHFSVVAQIDIKADEVFGLAWAPHTRTLTCLAKGGRLYTLNLKKPAGAQLLRPETLERAGEFEPYPWEWVEGEAEAE